MSHWLSPKDRLAAIENMRSGAEFDLAIVGGGINGAGVARDAASRGMKVALVEAADFASGTSSRSSKLIHGGIRYLENLEFGLVFEALSERQMLFDMAPHLVHPLRFLLPVYKTGRVPAWKMGLGMWVYDALSLFEAPELHKFLSKREVASELPVLQGEQLSGAFAYYDAYMDDDRLVFETLRSAHSMGAQVANFVKATGAEIKDGHMRALVCEDQLTRQTFSVRAKHFVSGVGPWTDRLGRDLFPGWKKTLRPSKGVHLTFSADRLPLKDAVVMGAEQRIVFAIPRHDMVIVGTTDTDFPVNPAQVRTEREDVDYLLTVIEHYFPRAGITSKDIIGCYAGVRPLIDDGAKTESKTSREHSVWTTAEGCTFVAGGKYTTYRNMATQVVDQVLQSFPIESRVAFGKSQTTQPLNPMIDRHLLKQAKLMHQDWAKTYGLSLDLTAALVDRHGFEAQTILERAAEQLPSGPRDEQWLWCAEALHAIEATMCLNLNDFYFRRTHLVLSRQDHGLSFMQAVAETMAKRLGWSSSAQAEQINALQKQIEWDLFAILSS